MSESRAILHVDMDAFYASVEQHDRPELAGRPVLVGGTGGRGVVAAASYEARRYGVHSAMPMREALRRCPQAEVVRPRMKRYQEVSHQVFEVFREFTPLVQGLSLDEAFLDVTASQSLFGGAEAIAVEIRRRIRERTGLAASVGVSHNKLLAKFASDMAKPDGLFVIHPDQVATILDPLPVRRLHGIGARTAERLEAAGINTLGQLRASPEAVLGPFFGRQSRQMRERAAGSDDRPVQPDVEEQQVSAEETFDTDLKRHEEMQRELARLAERACARLRAKHLVAGLVTVKVRRRDFSTYTRQKSFAPPTDDARLIRDLAASLLDGWLAEQPRAAVRLLGVGLAHLAPATQMELFGGHQPVPSGKLDDTLDRIRAKFGDTAVLRGNLLPTPEEE
jgi:DNA polymerase-4